EQGRGPRLPLALRGQTAIPTLPQGSEDTADAREAHVIVVAQHPVLGADEHRGDALRGRAEGTGDRAVPVEVPVHREATVALLLLGSQAGPELALHLLDASLHALHEAGAGREGGIGIDADDVDHGEILEPDELARVGAVPLDPL